VARGRQSEHLVLHLSIPDDFNLSPDAQHSLLKDMAAGYFRTAGAVTTAMREQIERLNAYFVQRNQQASPGSAPAPALVSMASLRDDRVTLAQCGPVQAFLLDERIHHFYDPQSAGRGLGLGQATDIRFFHIEVAPDQLMLMLAELPTGWNEKTLSNIRGQRLATLRRRFLGDAGTELRAVLVSMQSGHGKLITALGEGEPREPAAPVRRTTTSRATPTAALSPTAAQPSQTWEQVQVPSESSADSSPASAPDELEHTAPIPTRYSYEEQPPAFEDEPLTVGQRARPERGAATRDLIAGWQQRASAMGERILPPVRRFLERVLPEEPVFNLPPRVMGLIAILVPIAVVILVAVVYLQFGRGQLYVNYLERAQSVAAIAAASQEPVEVRQAWEGVVYYAERAAVYEQDQQTAAELLAQAQRALDDLDAIRRVEFVPALGEPLGLEANITRMVANNNEIYMLDANEGKIIRAFLAGDGAGGGYQIDEDFACEPGPYGDFIVSELVDLALLPRENGLDADLIAMDRNGNVIYCSENERPIARTLLPPAINWGQPRALRTEGGSLYVLDPLTNAVWLFEGEDFSYAEEPRFFFGAEVPNLRRMLDLALEGDALYLVNEEGHIAICEYRDDPDLPTTCQNPAQFTDARPGRTSGDRIEGANFSQIQISEPPQPALYMLDPVARAVYRFSLQLGLDTQFQSSTELPEGLVTAFAITPNRAILMAFENDVYIGFMPSDP
jgi:hypothetical protein